MLRRLLTVPACVAVIASSCISSPPGGASLVTDIDATIDAGSDAGPDVGRDATTARSDTGAGAGDVAADLGQRDLALSKDSPADEDAPPLATTWRIPFTISAGSVSEDLVDFVALVDEDGPDNVVSNPNGGRFVSADGTPLPAELEAFDPQTGALRAWVRLPLVAATQDVRFYFELTEADAPRIPGEVWEGWVGVWHLDEHRDGATAVDSSPAQNHGTVRNTSSGAAAGKIGGAIRLDGVDDHVVIPNHPTLEPMTGYTLTAWAFLDRSYGSVISRPETTIVASYNNSYQLWLDPNDNFIATISTDGQPSSVAVSGYEIQAWHHLAITWDGAQMRQYVDGIEVANVAKSGQIDYDAHDVFIGIDKNANPDGSEYIHMPLQGLIDEARIAPIPASGARVAAWFANQSAPREFVVAGALEAVD